MWCTRRSLQAVLGIAFIALTNNVLADEHGLRGRELVIWKKSHRHVVRPATEILAVRAASTNLPIQTEYGRYGTLADPSGDYKKTCADIVAAFPDLACARNEQLTIQTTPNDSFIGDLPGLVDINASAAWSLGTSGGMKVAVIDTGVDASHPDLAANMIGGYDFVDNDSDPADQNGHGTHVAGTIGAVGNNGIGVAGICWNVSIMPVRVLDASGSGTLADVAQGIEYAVNHGAGVMNLSLGGMATTAVLSDAFNYAETAGVVAAVAAGNYGLNNDEIDWYPANYRNENIISVAAAEGTELADFSHYGPTSVDIGAPGVNVLSTLPGGTYGEYSGTSMASPHVAGAAALLKGANSNLSGSQIKSILLSTAQASPSFAGKTVSGGILNLGAAMESALGVAPAVVAISIRQAARKGTTTITGRVTENDQPAAKRLGLYKGARRLKITTSSNKTGKYVFRTSSRGKFQVRDTFSSASSKALKIR